MSDMDYSVLIVDDEPDLVDIVEFQVEALGYKVFKAYNGNEAFKLIQENQIDLVISDVQMPNGDGLSLIQDTRKEIGDKPVFIFMSGLLDSNKRAVMDSGAFDYLEKPASFEDIKIAIDNAVETLKR